MKTQELTETHAGHKLWVQAFEKRPNVWTWNYLIDGAVNGFAATNATLPTAEAALKRGLLMARARAVQMS